MLQPRNRLTCFSLGVCLVVTLGGGLVIQPVTGLHLVPGDVLAARDVVRPEKVVSKRLVAHDQETYTELARLWQEYYKEFPSEDAYANWMYATRYAGLPDYERLLDEGIEKFPGNPVLHYLAGLRRHGASDNRAGLEHLQRAVALDPTFMDPWFALATHYKSQNDQERLNVALRHLLEGGAISDFFMDYSYNMLVGLAPDAILVTNGDNDTYPGWILTRLLNHRPDVTLVNRSLLNTDWYPLQLLEQGVPAFITGTELTELRERALAELKSNQQKLPPMGPFTDPLLERLITAAAAAERPVYFTWTLTPSDLIDRYLEQGRPLGMVVLVTPPHGEHRDDLNEALDHWLHDYRTGGLDSWQLRHAIAEDASLVMARNYAAALHRMMADITTHTPNRRSDLFLWYQQHVADLMTSGMRSAMNHLWCEMKDVPEISAWCRKQGFGE